MVYSTPEQDKIVERPDWPAPIRSAFKEFDVTFVILHPFLKIKPDSILNLHLKAMIGRQKTKLRRAP